MSALYYLFLWTSEVLLGGLILASFTRLIDARWLQGFRAFERYLPWAWLLSAALFAANFSAIPKVDGHGYRAVYFSAGFLLARGLIYYLVWAALLFWQRRCARFGSVMLIALLFTGSLASFDWLLGLSRDFESTIFGLLFLASSTLLTYGIFLHAYRPKEHLNDLNTVHLVLIGSWTYLSVAQLLTIWSGNLPREVDYYLVRVHGGWRTFPEILALAQFLIPLVLLLFRKLKARPDFTQNLGLVSALMQSLYLYWALAPALHPEMILPVPEILLLLALTAGLTLVRCKDA